MKGKNGMVKFFQSWCGHCKRMKPDWDRLAEEANDSVLIADVDCGDQGDVSSVLEIEKEKIFNIHSFFSFQLLSHPS